VKEWVVDYYSRVWRELAGNIKGGSGSADNKEKRGRWWESTGG